MSDQPKPPWFRIVMWALVCAFMVPLLGPPVCKSLLPGPTETRDFFQDWASANYFLRGKSIYASQSDATREYLGAEVRRTNSRMVFNEVNAHPPMAVLLVLPLAGLDYPTAQLTWTLFWLAALALSIGLVLTGTDVSVPWWTVFMWVPLFLWCQPLLAELWQGQINRVILALVVTAWWFDRADRPWLAGACVGVAASIKALPLFLIVYFACRGRWRAVAATALTFVALNGCLALVFGIDTYRDYITRVVPFIDRRYRDDLLNISIAGYWARLFDPPLYSTEPLIPSPVLATVGSVMTRLVVITLAAWGAWKARSQPARDHAFGASVIAMLLLSPILWLPYCLLLILPGVLMWRDLPTGSYVRGLYFAAVSYLWIADTVSIGILGRQYSTHTAAPWESLTFLAAPTYALLALFGLSLWASRHADAPPPTPAP